IVACLRVIRASRASRLNLFKDQRVILDDEGKRLERGEIGTREHGLRVTVWMRLNSCEQGANRGFVVAGVEPHGMRGRRDGYRATLRKTSLGNHRGRGARLREDTGRRVRVVKEDADLRQVCSGDHASNLVSSNLLPRILDREHPRRWPWNRLTRRVSENDRN